MEIEEKESSEETLKNLEARMKIVDDENKTLREKIKLLQREVDKLYAREEFIF